ncbi:MAG: pyruvate kinase [Patescibacteria group bacterium]
MQYTQTGAFTKIVATIGPVSDTPEKLEALISAGMNVARLNTKHGTTEWHAERIDRIRAAAKKLGKRVDILLDLQGPEIRTDLLDKKPFDVSTGDQVHFVSTFQSDLQNQIKIPQKVIDSLNMNNSISLEDGMCEFEVTEKKPDRIVAKALGNCVCRDRKTMNTPGVVVDMPSLIPPDIEKLEMLHDHPVDLVALSFVRDKTDIAALQAELEKRKINSAIVAKIENRSALDHLDEIILNADAIMVARGDLGVEIPMEELAFRQKEIIFKSLAAKKFVITATQMMKSMELNPRPTRAEVCDVANAVFDGTDAVMLSEETTNGTYPVETVTLMRKIVDFNRPLIEKVKEHEYAL